MRNLKKDRKKGFTLVELIVVLVILAILAALLVPALTGYIDKAQEKQVTAETRQIVMAAQTLVDEEYAEGNGNVNISFVASDTPTPTAGQIVVNSTASNSVGKLAEINGLTLASGAAPSNNGEVAFGTMAAGEGKLVSVTYKAHGKTCKYVATGDPTTGEQYTVE